MISVTVSALALVTSVPLTRIGLDAGAGRPARRLVGLDRARRRRRDGGRLRRGRRDAGGRRARSAYGSDVGEELGRFVVALAPWMLVTVGVSVTFPLVFVAGAWRRLPLVALLVLVVHLPLAWLGDTVAGVYGLPLRLRSRPESH